MGDGAIGLDTVAVIIPTFNRRDLVVQAVASVVEQSYTNLRCIVVDNGSTDGTVDAITSLRDPRVRVLEFKAAMGAAAARNEGISAAEGARWVAFLDNDDLWAPTKLATQLAALSAQPEASWSATACVHVGADLKVRWANRLQPGPLSPSGEVLVSSEKMLSLFKESNPIPAGGSSVLVSRALAVEAGGFSPDVAGCEDWDLWLRLAKRSALCYVDLPLVAWRVWDGQGSTNVQQQVRSTRVLRARHFPESGPLPRSYLARWEREAARRHVAGGRRGAAARSYLRAAWTGRDTGQLAYLAAAVVSPSLTENRLRRIERARGLPHGWEDAVEPWLARWRS